MKVTRRIALTAVGVIAALGLGGIGTASAQTATHTTPTASATPNSVCNYECGVPGRKTNTRSGKTDGYVESSAKAKMTKAQYGQRSVGASTGHDYGSAYCKSCAATATDAERTPSKTIIHQNAGGSTLAYPAATYGNVWCRWYETWVQDKSGLGNLNWKYTQKITFCWQNRNGANTIVSHSKPEVMPKLYSYADFAGWKFSGTKEESTYHPYNNNWAITSHVSGQFQFCPPRVWCVQDYFPYTDMDMYGNGSADLNGWGM